MADAAMSNWAKYKAGFSNSATKKDFIKHSAFRFVDGMDGTKLASLGLKRESYPTPTNPGADGKGK